MRFCEEQGFYRDLALYRESAWHSEARKSAWYPRRMKDRDVFWKLEALSDRQLLERLGSMLGSSRRLMAELIAHLGEVEERRLHLVAACVRLLPEARHDRRRSLSPHRGGSPGAPISCLPRPREKRSGKRESSSRRVFRARTLPLA